jgi:two-component system response regulator TctD
LELLREIRAQKLSVPILITTARSTVTDRVTGLKLGADDYLVKPFALEELVARVEALLRRPHQMEDNILRAGNIEYSAARKTFSVNGTPYVLSARELTVLEILLRQKGRVVTKALIEGEVFGFGGEISSNAVEVYMHRLRKQLAESAANIEIHTVRGVGYILEEPK